MPTSQVELELAERNRLERENLSMKKSKISAIVLAETKRGLITDPVKRTEELFPKSPEELDKINLQLAEGDTTVNASLFDTKEEWKTKADNLNTVLKKIEMANEKGEALSDSEFADLVESAEKATGATFRQLCGALTKEEMLNMWK